MQPHAKRSAVDPDWEESMKKTTVVLALGLLLLLGAIPTATADPGNGNGWESLTAQCDQGPLDIAPLRVRITRNQILDPGALTATLELLLQVGFEQLDDTRAQRGIERVVVDPDQVSQVRLGTSAHSRSARCVAPGFASRAPDSRHRPASGRESGGTGPRSPDDNCWY